MASRRQTRALSRRTITVKPDVQRPKAAPAAPTTKKLPIVTINVIIAESTLLIVIPGYSRIAMATAHAIMSRILLTCQDGPFSWMDGFRIGPGDRLKTCTSLEIRALNDGHPNAGSRTRLLGELAFPATCRALTDLVESNRPLAYDAKLVIHDEGAVGLQ